jgi:hypothetical protein
LELLTPLTNNHSDPEHSLELRRASRAKGRTYVPVYDIECSNCYRLFVPAPETETRCRRCRRNP